MSESKLLMRSLLGATVLLWGLGGQARATYGGGACRRCAPAASVVATQYNVVALAPQVQTVMRTVYETAYEYQPYTVLETRYRQGLSNREHHRDAPGHGDHAGRPVVPGEPTGLSDH